MRVLLVAEQVFPPVVDGSTRVYKNCLEALAERNQVSAVLFGADLADTQQAESYLGAVCHAHLLLPGPPSFSLWKLARTLLRNAGGSIFAARWLEEWGRAEIHRRIVAFIAEQSIDVAIFQKLLTQHLFGVANLRALLAHRILDLHDDWVAREEQERAAFLRVANCVPDIGHHPLYNRLAMRHRLSRFDPQAARRQEARMLERYDRVLVSAPDELASYRRRMPDARWSPIFWPMPVVPVPERGGTGGLAAGFIASDSFFNFEGLYYFCSQILPAVRRTLPAFRLLVAGSICRAVESVKLSWDGVELLHKVRDAADFYGMIDIVVVPLLSGTGVSLKTLEAMAHGAPVIATTIGARGIDAVAGQDLLVADRPDGFVDALLGLAASPAGRRELGRRGRERVKVGHDAAAYASAIERLAVIGR